MSQRQLNSSMSTTTKMENHFNENRWFFFVAVNDILCNSPANESVLLEMRSANNILGVRKFEWELARSFTAYIKRWKNKKRCDEELKSIRKRYPKKITAASDDDDVRCWVEKELNVSRIHLLYIYNLSFFMYVARRPQKLILVFS